MNKDYLKFLKTTAKLYKNINWCNKEKVKYIRSVWFEVKDYKNYSLTKHFFSKHNLLLKFGLRTENKSFRLNSIDYWIMRGWSEDYAKSKVSKLQISNVNKSLEKFGCSVSSRKYQKIQGKSEAEIDMIMSKRKRFSFNDFSIDELKQVSIKGSKARKEQIEYLKKYNPQKLKEQYNTTLEYYLAKGYSVDEANTLLKKRQATFSKEICISKYGEVEGLRIFKNRQNKWLKTLDKKTDFEKKEINSKKAVSLSNLQRKYGDKIGEQKYRKIMERRKAPGSREADNFFRRVLNDIIVEEEPYWSQGESGNEYFLYDRNNKKYYFYDFTLRNKKIIIEYHGESFHPRKDKLTESEWENWKLPFTNESADSKYNFDQKKNKFAETQGFKVIEIWSSDTYEESLKKIVKLI